MARAIVRAGSSLATFSFVSIEALAVSGATIANTSVSTLSIAMKTSKFEFVVVDADVGQQFDRSLNPSQLKGTDAIGTITTVQG